ncbi:protease sohB [Vibrio ishigakensis]|uniref:Protease sohB n=1 Tax=Vibrio ishigakensis TaxID=1481914 RepID=A0A0B8QE95_9VIBR|nr:protease sohB [Vibrio ishigakensis]
MVLIVAKSASAKSSAKGTLEVTNLSEQHQQNIELMEHHLHDEAFIKARDKAEKKKA